MAMLTLAMLAPVTAIADGAAAATPGILTIDNLHTYAGMDKTYAAGYVPVESGGKVRIVLPLIASAAIVGNAITVTPDLGAPGSSPFVFGNYIVTVVQALQSMDNGMGATTAYLVDLSLPLAADRMQGTYPITLDIAYKDSFGVDMQQSFPLYVTVDGKAPATPGAGFLSIDNQHIYAGMDKTYVAGYVPTETDGKVRVVLPLVASSVIQGGAITVTPQLGSPGSSPFVYGNYVETVALASQNVDNGAGTVSAYLVDLSLKLAADRTQGTYPITLDVSYKDGSGADKQQSFPLYVTVDGKTPAVSGAGLLSIDNRHVYAGMNKTYVAGYVPVESGGKVRVVLPLVASAAIQGSAVTVTPELGAPGTSPFVYGNYIETVALASQSVNNGAGSVAAYLIDLSLPLARDRTRGTYPITLDVAYKDGSGNDMHQSFPLYVTVDGKAPATAPPPETPRHQPKVIVSKYAVSPDSVIAGQDFTLSFTLENTSDSYEVYNLKVTIRSDTADLFPADNKDTLFYSSLASGASLDVTFPMAAKEDAAIGAHGVTVSIDYEDSKATGFIASENIPVTVTQPLRVEFDTPNVPDAMTAGDTAPFTLQVINKGRSAVYNVMCVLEAPGLLPEASAFLGNMDPGTAKPAQIIVFAGTLDMTSSSDISGGSDGSGQYGKTTGTITITYEDEYGKQYSAKVKIQTTINEPVVPVTATKPPEQPKAGQWWVSVVIAAALIAAVLILLLLGRKNRMRKVQGRAEQ